MTKAVENLPNQVEEIVDLVEEPVTELEAKVLEEVIPDKNPTHYVDNVEFWNELVAFRAANKERVAQGLRPNIPDSIGKKILEICQRLAYRYNFIVYPQYREDMVSDAVMTCILYIWNFDTDKSKNPFSYFTLVAFRSFIRRIQKEKKRVKRKQEYFEHLKVDIFNVGGHIDTPDETLSKELNEMLFGPEFGTIGNRIGGGDYDEHEE